MFNKAGYRSLDDSGSYDSHATHQKKELPFVSWLLHAALLTLSFGFSVSGLWARNAVTANCPRDGPSIYSPALEAVQSRTVRLNGSFKHESVFKGTPTPDLDKAWSKLTAGDVLPGPLISVSKDELIKVGQDDNLDTVVKLPPEQGGGYVGSIEVFHQLHCLNMLRQITYPDHYEGNSDPEKINRMHIDHCIDMLRQHIMCRGDTGIVTGRDFDSIYEWADQRRVTVSQAELKKYRGEVSLEDIP